MKNTKRTTAAQVRPTHRVGPSEKIERDCPHCGTRIVLSTEQVFGFYVFAKCSLCGGLAMVQSSQPDPFTVIPEVPKLIVPPPPPIAAIQAAAKVRCPDPLHFELGHQEAVPVNTVGAYKSSHSRAARIGATALLLGVGGLGLHYIREGLNPESFPVAATVHVSDESPLISSAAAPVPRAAAPEPVVSEAPAALGDSTPPALMAIRVSSPAAVLRAGPGIEHARIGIAKAELQLLVKSQQGNWIEVDLGERSAWIRNDLVRPLRRVATRSGK